MSNVLRRSLRDCYHRVSDRIDLIIGRRDSLTPPWRIIHDGSTSLAQFRSQFPTYLKEATQFGLEPQHSVLDVGCGNGKLGIVLTKYLTDGGSYDGFDIVGTAIEWCSRHITPQYPNIRFRHADVYNTHYNPHGRLRASEFAFPYDSARFDFVQLGSLFTHLVPESMEHYLAEVARVLKPNGICLITYYLLTGASKRGIQAGWAAPKFQFAFGSEACRVENKDDPEAIIAYDEQFVRRLYQKYGLAVEEPIVYGKWWWGAVNDQDMIKGFKQSSA